MGIKFSAVLLVFIALIVLTMEYGVISISYSSLSIPLLDITYDYFLYAPFIYAIFVFAFLIAAWIHIKRFSFRMKTSYQQAYLANHHLIEIVSQHAIKIVGRGLDARPTKSFRPSLLNKRIDCGRYSKKDGTLSPRVVVKLPLNSHLSLMWLAIQHAFKPPLIYWELAPLPLAIWVTIKGITLLILLLAKLI